MTSRIRASLILHALLLGAVVFPACAPRSAGPGPSLAYGVALGPGGFELRLEAEDLPGRRPVLRLLDSWGTLAGMPGHVTDLRATDETGGEIPVAVEQADGETRWRLARNPGRITITYRVKGYGTFVSRAESTAEESRMVLIG